MNAYKVITENGLAMLETRERKKKVTFTLFNMLTKNVETRTKLFDFENATNEINEHKNTLKHAKYKIIDVEKSTIIVKTTYPIAHLIDVYLEHKFDDDVFVNEIDEINDDENDENDE